MEVQYASVWEKNSDVIPDKIALICGNNEVTWKEYDDRAARLASLLSEAGLGDDSKVGLYLHNSNEYLEAQYSVFKIKGVPINVNYRYKEEELVYLLDNSDSEAIFYQGCYAEQIKSIKGKLPKVKLYIQVDDGTNEVLSFAKDYESSISTFNPMDRIERSSRNIYMLYTGGTTGMPKGVMYEHEGHLTGMLNTAGAWGLIPVQEKIDIDSVAEEVKKLADEDRLPVSIPACPLMHGTGMWLGAIIPHLVGGTVVTLPQLGFDPDNLLKEVERTRANNVVIVGDAFAKPIMDALDKAEADGNPYNLESINTIISSGVMWSSEVKQGLLKHHDMIRLSLQRPIQNLYCLSRDLENHHQFSYI